VGQILTQVADNLMVGRYGGGDPVPLAAVSFGGSSSSSSSSPPSASRWA